MRCMSYQLSSVSLLLSPLILSVSFSKEGGAHPVFFALQVVCSCHSGRHTFSCIDLPFCIFACAAVSIVRHRSDLCANGTSQRSQASWNYSPRRGGVLAFYRSVLQLRCYCWPS